MPSFLRRTPSNFSRSDVFVFFQEDAGVFATLAHAFAAEANPRSGFLEDAFVDAEVDQVAFAGDAFAVEDVDSASRNGAATLFFTTLRACASLPRDHLP